MLEKALGKRPGRLRSHNLSPSSLRSSYSSHFSLSIISIVFPSFHLSTLFPIKALHITKQTEAKYVSPFFSQLLALPIAQKQQKRLPSNPSNAKLSSLIFQKNCLYTQATKICIRRRKIHDRSQGHELHTSFPHSFSGFLLSQLPTIRCSSSEMLQIQISNPHLLPSLLTV